MSESERLFSLDVFPNADADADIDGDADFSHIISFHFLEASLNYQIFFLIVSPVTIADYLFLNLYFLFLRLEVDGRIPLIFCNQIITTIKVIPDRAQSFLLKTF